VFAVATAVKKKQVKAGGTRRRGRMPVKRTINFAGMGEKPVNVGLAIPSIILIALAAIVFSKFLVIDRMAEVDADQRAVYELQQKLDAGYEELADFDELSDLYAHYTYSGITQEELARADRVAVLKLIDDTILPYAAVSSWSVSGNELTVNMSGESLEQIKLIVQQIEAHDLVNFCTVNTANTNDNTKGKRETVEYDEVKARVLVYLNSEAGVNVG
jgi:hypothetical protein